MFNQEKTGDITDDLDETFEPWSAKKASILTKYSTSEKLSITTSFLSASDKEKGISFLQSSYMLIFPFNCYGCYILINWDVYDVHCILINLWSTKKYGSTPEFPMHGCLAVMCSEFSTL